MSVPAIGRRLGAAVVALVAMAGLFAAAPPARAVIGTRYVDEVFAGYDEIDGLAYGSAVGQNGPETLLLDLFQPTGDVVDRRPVVIYIHGGFFAPGLGDRTSPDARAFAMSMARRGYVVASIDYRLYGGALMDLGRLATGMQAALDDAQAAVRWFRANATTYRVHPDAVAVAGYSAGAITALNVGFHPTNAGASGNAGYRHDVQAVISYAGFASQATAGAPPIQMSGGDMDTLVPYNAQVATCNAAVALGDLCQFNTYPGADHISMGTIYMLTDLIPKAAVFLDQHIVPNLASRPSSVLAPPTAVAPPRPANGSASENADGRLEVFGATAGGVMQNVFQHVIGQGWSGFYPFPNAGGSLTASPIAAFHNADGRLETAFLGADGHVYHTGQRPGLFGWLPFEAVGQPGVTFASPPSFGINADHRLELFAISVGGVVMHSWQDRPNGSWSDWSPIAGPAFTTAAEGGVGVLSAYSPGPARMVIAAVGADGQVHVSRQNANGLGWVPFTAMGGSAVGRPEVRTQVVPVPPAGGGPFEATVLVYVGSDGFLHQAITDRTGTPTHATIDATRTVAHNPSVTTNADGRLEVFVAGGDGLLWHAFQGSPYASSFSTLYPLGGSCTHSPSALPNDDGRLEVFCVASGGALLHDFQRWPNGPWFGSTSLGGALVA